MANPVPLDDDFPRPIAFQTTPEAVDSEPMFAAIGPGFPRKFADNEIVFVPNSPYLHIEKLKPYIQNANSIGVLYKQNDYGLKVFDHFKKNFPKVYHHFGPMTSS